MDHLGAGQTTFDVEHIGNVKRMLSTRSVLVLLHASLRKVKRHLQLGTRQVHSLLRLLQTFRQHLLDLLRLPQSSSISLPRSPNHRHTNLDRLQLLESHIPQILDGIDSTGRRPAVVVEWRNEVQLDILHCSTEMFRLHVDVEMAWSSLEQMSVICSAMAVASHRRWGDTPGHSGGLKVEEFCCPEEGRALGSGLLADLGDDERGLEILYVYGLHSASSAGRLRGGRPHNVSLRHTRGASMVVQIF